MKIEPEKNNKKTKKQKKTLTDAFW